MSGVGGTRRSRRTLIVVLVAVVAALAIAAVTIGLVTAGASSPTERTSAPAPTAVPTTIAPPPTPTPTATATATPTPSATRTTPPKRRTAPTPQPTKTASLEQDAPIKQELTAEVTRTEAVQGEADGPGEIAGPAVRFTIRITNTTGKRVDLANTVVNAYSGDDDTPAVPLLRPGGKAFPAGVADGAEAQGVFVFNIPVEQRDAVKVTVDTDVANPVIAFEGSVPR